MAQGTRGRGGDRGREPDLSGLPSGPRKQRPPEGVAPRQTTHKTRSVWFQTRAAWPLREAPVHALVAEQARAALTLAPPAATAQWESVGPTNTGGRMTSVVCDPANPDLIWAGAAGGGVWKSQDGGRTWRGLWHKQPTLNIGALAIDPTHKTLYCGTGEANLSADSYPGVGLFRSIDGGENWQILAPSATAGIPMRIGALAVDPFDSNHLRLGGVKHTQEGTDGLFVSHNGGVSWARETFPGSGPYRCHAIIFDPTARGTLYVTIDARGSQNGVWKSTDSGGNWTHLTAGFPAPAAIGRTSLAIARSQPRTLYAISANSDEGVVGVFRTDDGGTNWRNVAGNHFAEEGQMSYGNTIAVNPASPEHVLCGGVDLHLTRDGGRTWTQATRWDARRGVDSDYAHADHHRLLMPAGRPGFVYDMNDGGMDVSTDGGRTWSNRSNGLATTMFYDIDVAQSDGRMFGGGAQDNGTNLTVDGRPERFFEITGGDGGWMLIDPTSTGHLYTTSQFMTVYRYRAGSWAVVSPPAQKPERDRVWMVFLDMDPNDPRKVFAGGTRVWRTTNDGARWQAVSNVLDGSAITAVEIAAANSAVVYVGTENGGFFRSQDGGNSWSADLASSVLPGLTITRIAASPADPHTVFITVANFGSSHVFRSSNGGDTWTDVDRRRLPDVPHHAIAIPRARPATLYIANDVGVFVSSDSGGTWSDLTANLPNVPIVDLVYHERDATLSAATYGRSLWRLKV